VFALEIDHQLYNSFHQVLPLSDVSVEIIGNIVMPLCIHAAVFRMEKNIATVTD
jgi:hypothetical protein